MCRDWASAHFSSLHNPPRMEFDRFTLHGRGEQRTIYTFFSSEWHKKDTGQTFFPKNDPNLTGAKIIQIEPKLNQLVAFNFFRMPKNAFNWTDQKSITENMAIKIWFNAVQSRSIEPKKYIYRGSKNHPTPDTKIHITRHLITALAWSGLPAAAPSRKWWVRARAGSHAARSKILNGIPLFFL